MSLSNKPTLLIVDDNPTNIDILVGLLSGEYDLLAVLSGPEALEIAAKEAVDLILLDIMMPGMSGLDVCRKLRQDEATQAIPVIFLTAKNDEATIEESYEAGGDDYISKPFKPKELRARINNRLELSSYRHQLEQRVEEEIAKRQEREQQLFQQSKLAAMGEMIGAVAHQWMQPIQVISAYISTLEMDYQDQLIDETYIRNYQSDMQVQINHLASTLREFRTFLSPNKSVQSFELGGMIHSVMELMKDDLHKYMIEIALADDNKVKIMGVENEFKHIFINLFNNAKDAFVENKITPCTITVKAEEQPDEVLISVQDNAGGIPEAVIDRVFDANVTTKPEGKGTGTGLYMSRLIVEKLNGRIDVANVEGGARFTLRIPR